MTATDAIVLGIIAAAAVYGVIRGVVSQLMGIFGLILGVLFAGRLAPTVAPWLKAAFNLSTFMADKAALFAVGCAIYVACRLLGALVQKSLISKSRELKSINRLGGGIFGAVKGTFVVGLFLCFAAVLPKEWVRSWFPKLPQSQSYKLASRFNPFGDGESLERMRKIRSALADPKQRERAKKSPEVRRVLERHRMPAMLDDRRLQKVLEEGDYDTLHRNSDFDGLVKEDELADLLEKIEKDAN